MTAPVSVTAAEHLQTVEQLLEARGGPASTEPAIFRVRGFGVNRTHLVSVAPAEILRMSWPGPAYPFMGIMTPLECVGGRQVASVQDCVVVLDADRERVTCELCKLMHRSGQLGPR
jgi:hypothetical protein